MSHNPNAIRLNPLNRNQILQTQGPNEIDLVLDPFIPAGWKPNPGSKVVGGGDVKTVTDKSSDGLGTPDKGSGNR
jgi:hypothetical protein